MHASSTLRALSCVGLAAAAASAVAHVVGAGHLGVLGAAVSVAMAASCLGCTAHLVRRPAATGAWLTMAVMAAGMIAIHMMVMGTGHMSGHVHAAGVTIVPGEMSGLMQVMLIASGAELLIAVVGLWAATSETNARTRLQLDRPARR